MGILRRAADVLSANVNDLVDRFEVPERMLRQALREMEDLLAATSAAVARSIATERLLVKSRAMHLEQIELWNLRAGEALDAEDDSLARRAVAQKLNHERAVANLDRQLADVCEANQALRSHLNVLRERHAAARSKVMLIAAQQAAADAHHKVVRSCRPGRLGALARFEKFYAQAELAHEESMALLELETADDVSLESQIDPAADQRAIDRSLEALKAGRSAEVGP